MTDDAKARLREAIAWAEHRAEELGKQAGALALIGVDPVYEKAVHMHYRALIEAARQSLAAEDGRKDGRGAGPMAGAWCCHMCVDKLSFNERLSVGMILCPICGNRRCPHASSHTLPCSGSNDVGQPGSVYRDTPK